MERDVHVPTSIYLQNACSIELFSKEILNLLDIVYDISLTK